MSMRFYFPLFLTVLVSCSLSSGRDIKGKETLLDQKPNVIIIYADDLGYGDVGYAGAKGVETPNIDFLSDNGLTFYDGHSSSATCTPSRYSLLTGNYAFRKKAAVLAGDAPLLIDTSSTTLASIFQASNYETAVVGKWHIGLGDGNLDWNTTIKLGPKEIGFDYSFLIPATGDRVPCVYVENGKVVNADPQSPVYTNYKRNAFDVPSGLENRDLLKLQWTHKHNHSIVNGISRIGYMTGGETALWKDEDMADTLTKRALTFIEENENNPFFLYFSFHDIHVPRVPHARFVGKSSMGSRGDAIVQMDWCVGQITEKLRELDILENTIVVLSSDNGPILDDGYADKASELVGFHSPSGAFSGTKYSSYEGGTRVPFVFYWDKHIKAGTSNALVSQVDFLASFADLIGYDIQDKNVLDSENHMQTFLGKKKTGREYLIEESYTLSLRKGKWKLTQGVKNVPAWIKQEKGIDPGLFHEDQLFNLDTDSSESINVIDMYPELASLLKSKLSTICNPVN